MALQTTVQPVDAPGGIRFTTGLLDFNGATYSVGGNAVTVAQWGAASVGQNRLPDFVIFNAGAASDDGDGDASTQLKYIASSGKVQVYGEEALTADVGLLEQDAEASSVKATFLAVWVNPALATTA